MAKDGTWLGLTRLGLTLLVKNPVSDDRLTYIMDDTDPNSQLEASGCS